MASASAFIISALINLVIFVINFLLFSCLRPRHPKVYAPRLHVFKENQPPAIGDGLFAWIPAVLGLTKAQIINYAGTDAYMFIQFIKFGIKSCGALALLGAIMLWPTNLTGDVPDSATGDEATASGIDNWSISNVEEEDPTLWVHTFYIYGATLILAYLLVKVWQDYVEVRHDHLSRSNVENRSILAFGLPQEASVSDEALVGYFNRIYPGTVSAASTIPSANEVDKCQEELNTTIVKLENAAYKAENGDDTPMHKENAKCFCIGGTKVESVPTYRAKAEEVRGELANLRGKSWELMPSGFVTFNTVTEATVAAQCRHTADPDNTTMLAPEPRDVLWKNLALSEKKKLVRERISQACTYALVLFWTIPVAFASSLSNLEAISENDGFGWLSSLFEVSSGVTGLIEGYLPTIVLAVFMAILPMILAAFTKFEGVPSNSLVTYGVVKKFFLFQLFNVLLTTTISGAIFDSLSELSQNPSGVVDLLATSLPTVSTFFAAYLSLQGLTILPGQLLRVGPLIVSAIKLKYLAKTSRAIRDVWNGTSGELDWGRQLPGAMFVGLVSVVYCPIQPLVPIMGCIYFCVALLTWSYNMMYVFKRSFETGGRMWPLVFDRTIWGMYIGQITIIGLLGLKKAPAQAALAVPCLFITAILSSYCKRDFEAPGSVLPLDKARTLDSAGSAGAEAKAGAPAGLHEYARPSFNPLYDFVQDQPAYDPDAEQENPMSSKEP